MTLGWTSGTWVVKDRWLGYDAVGALRRELPTLPLAAAGTGRGAALDPDVRGDAIAWLDRDGASPAIARVLDAFEALRGELNRDLFLGLGRFEAQAAHYAGGGARYVRHRDAFRGGPNANRRLTAIYYVNEAWTPAHGGVLRLYPEPDGPPVDVEPRADRLVVFLSAEVEHEVLPVFAPRWAVTAWYYGREDLPP